MFGWGRESPLFCLQSGFMASWIRYEEALVMNRLNSAVLLRSTQNRSLTI